MHADHPHADPHDGRTECDICGKFVWLALHSCKGVPVTPAAWARWKARRRALTEPNPGEQAQYWAWMERHRAALTAAWEAAERLQRAQDRAALATADGNPAIPAELQEDIDACLAEWEALRWGGQRKEPS
jgi:hypothetical protein